MFIDLYGRRITRLRVSITRKCSYNCLFCHREGEVFDPLDELTPQDIDVIAEAARSLGITEIKLTGGEPLEHDEVLEIVARASRRVAAVSMNTNGYYLADYAYDLKRSGLKRVNVSLHAVDGRVYEKITGVNGVERVIEGIACAVDAGLKPVKLNFVLLRGLNEEEFWGVLSLAKELGCDEVKLIELHPLGEAYRSYGEAHGNPGDVLRKLYAESTVCSSRALNNRLVLMHKTGVRVEVVRPVDNPYFCLGCMKLRITSTGEIKPCLMRSDNHVSIRAELRSPSSFEEKVSKVMRALIRAVRLREPFNKFSLEDSVFDVVPERLRLDGDAVRCLLQGLRSFKPC